MENATESVGGSSASSDSNVAATAQGGAATKEDCIKYDPATAGVTDEGLRGRGIKASKTRLVVLDTKAEAEQALVIVKSHSAQCFIGRDNKRPQHGNYVFKYWK